MKRKVLAVFACILVLTLQLLPLVSCEKEEDEVYKEVPKYSGDGDNLIKSELYGASLSDVFTLFADALSGDFGLVKAIDDYDLQFDLAGRDKLILKDGVVCYSEWENKTDVVKHAATYGENGLKLISYSEKISGYEENKNVTSSNNKLFALIPKIKEAIIFAEEHFDLSSIEEKDVTESFDGFKYLSNEYVSELIRTVCMAQICLSRDLVPEEVDMTEIDLKAQELAKLTDLKIGIGLKMKRIDSVKIVCKADEISDYTNEEITNLDFDLLIKLDGTYSNIESIEGFYKSSSDKNGSIDIQNLTIEAVRDQNGTPNILRADAIVKLTNVVLEVDKNTNEPIIGNRDIRLHLIFNPASTEQSLDLDFEDITKAAGSEEVRTYVIIDVGSFRGKEPAKVELKYSVPSLNVIDREKTGTAKADKNIQSQTLEDAKALLGIK